MTSKEIRQKYIDFYKSKGHVEIPSASLVPENDPSVLFTTAGMHPLVPFLLGEKHPAGNRLVNSQKCIRTGDIDEVGNKTHHTFFEMLGHWSLGDSEKPDGLGAGYWKKEAIEMTFNFVTKELGLSIDKLAVSVFEGDENISFDEEAFDAWKELGFSEDRIGKLDKKENWWEMPGETGPCGPDTEMFYWTGEGDAPEKYDYKDSGWVEIGNDVLMQYEKKGVNNYVPADQKNIDNGTGLERLTAILNGTDDNYQTDLFLPIINKIEELSGKKYGLSEQEGSNQRHGANITRSMRIIADHIRAATFIMGDDLGIAPSNVDQGYVVRKLIRRAIRHGKLIGINEVFCFKIAEVVIDLMKEVYPELQRNKDFVINQMIEEEEKFRKTLEKGLKIFEKEIKDIKGNKEISGELSFDMFQTYGFPLEITKELADNYGFKVDEKGFEQEMKKHQEKSRTASAGKFKGGLSGDSEQAIKYHTATHLLLVALRKVLGDAVFQKGSNINDERMRFDFSYSEKLTDEQKTEVEDLVNEWIKEDLPVVCAEMSLDEAKAKNAMGVFGSKYGEQVKVYSIGDHSSTSSEPLVSREICGGPHVKRTGELGKFKIKKEESSSAGVRRIKAILE